MKAKRAEAKRAEQEVLASMERELEERKARLAAEAQAEGDAARMSQEICE